MAKLDKVRAHREELKRRLIDNNKIAQTAKIAQIRSNWKSLFCLIDILHARHQIPSITT